MELQIALLIAGIAVIALVVATGLFPIVGKKISALFSKSKVPEVKRTTLKRDQQMAPRLNGEDAVLLGEEELIDNEESLFYMPLINEGEELPQDIVGQGPSSNVSPSHSPNKANFIPPPPEIEQRDTRITEVNYEAPSSPASDVANINDPVDPLLSNKESSASISAEAKNDESRSNSAEQGLSDAPDHSMGSEVNNLAINITPTEIFKSLKQIDYWVKLTCPTEHTQHSIASQISTAFAASGLHTQTHALNVHDHRWHEIKSAPQDAAFKEFVVSFQLLNQGQPLSADKFRHFTNEVETLAENLGAKTQFLAPASEAAIQSANLASLYANCQGTIEVTIKAPKEQPFYAKIIQTSAKLQGLEFEAGSFARKKQMGSKEIILYRLSSTDGRDFSEDMPSDVPLQSVRFLMQPSTSQFPGRVVKEMLDGAKAYASRVKGEIQLFDDTEYHQDQMRLVRDYVSKIENKMQEVGIPAGSAEAIRLFS